MLKEKSQNSNFSKREIVHGFGQKFEIFPRFLTLQEKWQNSNSDPRGLVSDFGLKLEIFS